MKSGLIRSDDWIVRYIRTYFYLFHCNNNSFSSNRPYSYIILIPTLQTPKPIDDVIKTRLRPATV